LTTEAKQYEVKYCRQQNEQARTKPKVDNNAGPKNLEMQVCAPSPRLIQHSVKNMMFPERETIGFPKSLPKQERVIFPEIIVFFKFPNV
jgi:hypothetical protein